MRQLQTRITDGRAYAEWQGVEPGPVAPDNTYLFVDVTDTPSAQLGGMYDSTTQTWAPPPPPVTALRLSKLAFIGLLTPAEYLAMLGPQTDAQLAQGVGIFTAAPDPFLTEDPRVQMLLDYCAATNVLTAQRAADLYAAMIAASSSVPV